jgi:tetratricopeptide (TPR) repeat protein
VGGLFFFWRRLAGGAPSLHRALNRTPKRYNCQVSIRLLIAFLTLVTALSVAQNAPDKTASPSGTQEPSSRDTRIDISPPKDDDKSHPASKEAVEDLEGDDNPNNSDVQEFHPWNPLKAVKDIEVGDFYFKRKNYKAALERYKDALYYKNGDAIATFRVAECQEKLGDKSEAKKDYEQYLKILPDGPLAKDARASLTRLDKAR